MRPGKANGDQALEGIGKLAKIFGLSLKTLVPHGIPSTLKEHKMRGDRTHEVFSLVSINYAS